MAKVVYYRQCRLKKGDSHQVSYIPDNHAVKGKVLKLRGTDGEWENGWEVQTVHSNRVAGADLPDFHEISKAHLRATGDTRPKSKNK